MVIRPGVVTAVTPTHPTRLPGYVWGSQVRAEPHPSPHTLSDRHTHPSTFSSLWQGMVGVWGYMSPTTPPTAPPTIQCTQLPPTPSYPNPYPSYPTSYPTPYPLPLLPYLLPYPLPLLPYLLPYPLPLLFYPLPPPTILCLASISYPTFVLFSLPTPPLYQPLPCHVTYSVSYVSVP